MKDISEYLWIVFKLERNYYAVNSDLVSTIAILPEEIVPVPNGPAFVRGIYNLRGKVIPIVELRHLFDLHSMLEDYEEFGKMIDQRKQDHLSWVNELERCIDAGEKFTLATDPHLCAFGKWLYTYHTEDGSVTHHLQKLETPHAKLHQAAERAMECGQETDPGKRDACLKEVLGEVHDLYVPQVLKLLDETKETMKVTYREMMVVMEMDGHTFGVIVDEVASVESLRKVDTEGGIDDMAISKYIMGVGHSDTTGQDVLEIDDRVLLHTIVSESDFIKQQRTALQ